MWTIVSYRPMQQDWRMWSLWITLCWANTLREVRQALADGDVRPAAWSAGPSFIIRPDGSVKEQISH